MRCRLHIIGTDEEFIYAASELFAGVEGVTCEVGDVRDVRREGRVFVSPANSFGIMNGGIDRVYSEEMFPGCEATLQRKIRELRPDAVALGERPGLRVGSALWFLVDEDATNHLTALLAAPTMTVPCDVSETQNAYSAFMATLMLADRIYGVTCGHVHTIVCPALCCGVGRMDPAEAARQMAEAWTDFAAGRFPEEVENHGVTYMLLAPVRGSEAEPRARGTARRHLPGASLA
jgi:O-acetyl-ADP-ribose deacetylase (regulator of RNase III)